MTIIKSIESELQGVIDLVELMLTSLESFCPNIAKWRLLNLSSLSSLDSYLD